MSNLAGSNLGRYRIIERLGQGGMATVYRALDTRLEREVAIKTIRTDMFPPAVLPDVLARFEREAKALARLDHPNIVRVHDYGEHDNVPYLVMAFVTGGSLRERTGRIFSPEEAAALLAPVARALEYAHTMGILHRDIKPANILINDRGVPLLSDFGIAKILDTDNSQGLTATGMAIGTPEYMAPEQSSGEKVDARADIYALGVVLFELLSGRRPFEGNTPIDVMIKTRTAPLPSLGSLGLSVSPDVEMIVQRALARDTSERYATMGAFAEDLENLLKTGSLAGLTPGINPTDKTLQTPQPQIPSPGLPFTPPTEDSGRTITHPTPQPAAQVALDTGRTITTPPAFAPGSPAAPTTGPGPMADMRTAVTPQTPPPAPPPATPYAPPTLPPQSPSPASLSRRGLPIWVYGVGALILVLIVGGIVMMLNNPGATPVAATDAPTAIPKPAEVTITIWDTWSDEMELEATRALLLDFQATMPGLTIEFVNQPAEKDVLAALREGIGPDILILSNENIGTTSEGLVPVSQHGISIEDARKRFSPMAVAGVSWKNELWGAPLAQKAIAIVYNKEMVTPLDFPQDPKDVDGLVKRAYDFQRANNKFLVCNPGFSGGDPYFTAPIFFSAGIPGYINEAGDVFVNTNAGREAGRILKAWRITAGPRDANYDSCKAMFENGEAGSWWIGPWEKWLFTTPDMNLAVANFGKPMVTLRTAALTTNALQREHIPQAIAIINFLSRPESQVHMALSSFSIPTSEIAIATPELKENGLITGFFNVGNFGIPISPSPYSKAQWDPMSEAIRKIWNGDQLPAEALAIAHQKIVEAIAALK